ncbi:MAG: sigma-70 family RNA polymerase sigma factor [Chloroflexi bacterium]|nr:sigma-70 family RNA polymerase sigma factor [Chloroflexota bacterium]
MNTTITAAWTASSDEDLASAYAAGTRSSFEELVRRYSGSVYAFCLRMVGRPQDAEDLTQDVFVQLLKSLPSVRTDTPLRPWIFVIARNKCLDHLKRKRALSFSDVVDSEGDGEMPLPDPAPLPDELAERADLQELMQQAIAELPPRYRTVVALRYSSDLTFAEIGNVLALPENTVKTHFQRAKAMLRARLASSL